MQTGSQYTHSTHNNTFNRVVAVCWNGSRKAGTIDIADERKFEIQTIRGNCYLHFIDIGYIPVTVGVFKIKKYPS